MLGEYEKKDLKQAANNKTEKNAKENLADPIEVKDQKNISNAGNETSEPQHKNDM